MKKIYIPSIKHTHNDFKKKFEDNLKELKLIENELEDITLKINAEESKDPIILGKDGLDTLFLLKETQKQLQDKIKRIKTEKHNYYLKIHNLQINSFKNQDKKTTMDEYTRKLNLKQEQVQFTDLNEKYNTYVDCHNCDESMERILHDDQYVCFNCGFVINVFPQAADAITNNISNIENENQLICYKKINHFNDWLDQLQARGTNIPEEVFTTILLQLKKLQIDNFKKLDYDTMRNILKRLKLSKYYEQIPIIINKLNNEPTVVIDIETENKLKEMFKLIQSPFYQVKPKSRRNFLSYSYVLHKLCQLLHREDLVNCFPLLKSREKLIVQEQIWKSMVEILEWEFIPSI